MFPIPISSPMRFAATMAAITFIYLTPTPILVTGGLAHWLLKGQIEVAAIHICRSGAWTPPWLDAKFYNFVQGLNMPYRILECPERNWAPGKLTLSEKIDYLLHVS